MGRGDDELRGSRPRRVEASGGGRPQGNEAVFRKAVPAGWPPPEDRHEGLRTPGARHAAPLKREGATRHPGRPQRGSARLPTAREHTGRQRTACSWVCAKLPLGLGFHGCARPLAREEGQADLRLERGTLGGLPACR